jgi:hypothetical protein
MRQPEATKGWQAQSRPALVGKAPLERMIWRVGQNHELSYTFLLPTPNPKPSFIYIIVFII